MAVADGLKLMIHALSVLQEALTHQEENAERRIQEAIANQVEKGNQRIQETIAQEDERVFQEEFKRIHEALAHHEERTERRIQKALRQQEERAARNLQEVLRAHEARDREVQETVRELRVRTERAEEAEKKLQEKLEALEGRVDGASGRETLERVESRQQQLEASLQRTLDVFFPRVEALVVGMEGRRSPEEHPAVSSDTDSAFAASPSSLPSPSRTSLASPTELRASNTASEPINTVLDWIFGKQICVAAEEGRTQIVRRLLDMGVDIEASDEDGYTPLMISARKRHLTVVSLLLERGANVNARSKKGVTALHFAAWNDNFGTCINLLVDAGAQVNCSDDFGNTPLHFAAKGNSLVSVQTLLGVGASKTSMDINRKMPVDFALTDSVRQLLE